MSYRSWAIIGLGFIASRHIRGVKAVGDELLATCDTDPKKGADFSSLEKLMKANIWKRITHVAVCTPNDTHYEIVKKITDLGDGKTVLCEKPLTLNSSEAKEFTENVYTVLQLRYNPVLKEIISTLRGHTTVDLAIKAYREKEYWDSWKGDPKRSGGVLFNMGIHYIDLLLQILGPVSLAELKEYDEKYLAKGVMYSLSGHAKFHIELLKEPGPTERTLIVNGEDFQIEGATIPLKGVSTDLHTEVYRNLIKYHGLPISEALPSIELCEHLLR